MTIENPSIRMTIDQRRVDLLNDPNYGVILCFLEKYRSLLALPHYPFELLEDHLLHYQDQIPSQLIDLHYTLLKRISIGKNAQCDQFDSIITRFAARFDQNDREHVFTTGYLQSDIQIKIRILKNLLESQFDSNQTFRNTFADQLAQDIRSLPIGRDRFGADYWFFMDETGFVRLFREDVDADRTWNNIAQDRGELEKFIGLLMTDSIVRKKFSDWNIVCASFASLPPSDAFEQRYSPIATDVLIETIKPSEVSIPRKRGRPKRSTNSKSDVPVREEVDDPSKKRKYESENDQISVDDLSLAVRRSTHLQKTEPPTNKLIFYPPAVQVTNRRKKRKTPSIRSRRYQSTSSSDSSDSDSDSDSDTTVADLSPMNIEEEVDVSATDEQLRPAKTAHTSTITTLCNVCSRSDRPEVLLLCDSCNDAYHLECLRPILLSVPEGDWFCPLCEHRQLANCLMEKFQELTVHSQRMEVEKITKRSVQRKIPQDESTTASLTLHSIDNPNNVSQRGRHRRARFDMHQILDDQETVDFDVKLPEKITRLLHRRDRNTEQPIKRLSTHSDHPSTDPCELNEILGSPLVYVTSQNQSGPIKSAITNSKQTLQIARRWNDVQRRSRLKAINTQLAYPPLISHYTDENIHLDPDNTPCIESHHEIKGQDQMLSYSRINVHDPTPLIPVDIFASRNILQKVDATFDQLTRDIQFAVNEAHPVVPIETKSSDPVHVKRIQKRLFSPFMTKSSHVSLLSAGCQTSKSKIL